MGWFGRDPLDDVLMRWPDGSPMTIRHILRSIQCKGITGSGKSSGAGRAILNAVLAHPRSSVAIIAQKPEERDEVCEHFARHGKRDKLIIIEEGGESKCNFFADELASGADSRSMTEFITCLGQGLDAGQGGGGRENARFWEKLEERILFNSVEALRQGTGTVTAPSMLDFLTTAPYSPDTLKPPQRAEWEKGLHFEVMEKAVARSKTRIEAADYEVIKAFWSKEFPLMDDKPRSSGLAGVMNTLHNACTGLAYDMTSTESTVSPRMIDDGYSFLINMPFSIYGPTGRYVSAGWKYKLQKHILRRKWKPSEIFFMMMCDEYQESVTDFDPRFLAQSRSHGGCMFTLTQTVHSEYSQVGNQHKVDALTSNFGTHIYHLCDPKTAKAASDQIGQRLETIIDVSPESVIDPLDTLLGRSKPSISCRSQYAPILQPRVLQAQLRTGGPGNRFIVDGIAVRPGEPFASGENWIWCEFKQR
jgi:hypothetical protein